MGVGRGQALAGRDGLSARRRRGGVVWTRGRRARLAGLVLVVLVVLAAAVLVTGSAGADSGAVPDRPARPVVEVAGHDSVTLLG